MGYNEKEEPLISSPYGSGCDSPTSSRLYRRSVSSRYPKKKSFCDRLSEKNLLLLVYSACLLVAAVGNSIFFKKMTDQMPNYPYFLSQLTTIVYIPIFFSIVGWELKYTDFITPEMQAFPKYKFFFMGVFDCLSGICMLFGGVHTSGSTQALLLNSVIPITMILSYAVLGTRFRATQYIGATIILGGVVLALLPSFSASPSSGSSNENLVLFNIIFLIGMLPQGFSSVYKEIAFSDIELDVNYLQAWVAVFQLVFGFLVIPLNTLSFLGDSAVSWSELPSALSNGALCLFGVDSITSDCWTDVKVDGLPQCDSCSTAFVPVMLYILFNCSYNLFITLIIKHGSAALMYVVMTLRLPLVQIAFSLSFISSPPDSFSLWNLAGLLLIIAGLVCYRWTNTSEVDVEADVEDAAAYSDSDEDGETSAGDGSGEKKTQNGMTQMEIEVNGVASGRAADSKGKKGKKGKKKRKKRRRTMNDFIDVDEEMRGSRSFIMPAAGTMNVPVAPCPKMQTRRFRKYSYEVRNDFLRVLGVIDSPRMNTRNNMDSPKPFKL